MSSLVQRECNSDKNCSSCDKPIMKGQQYMAGPYKALCMECHEIEKKESVSPSKKATDDYIVSGKCVYCQADAIGMLWTKKICAAHINQVITETI